MVISSDTRWTSIPGLVHARAQDFRDREALVDDDAAVRLSFDDLAALMVRSTRAAIAAGLQPGDRAAIWAPNIHQWIGTALGILGAGGVLVGIQPLSPRRVRSARVVHPHRPGRPRHHPAPVSATC